MDTFITFLRDHAEFIIVLLVFFAIGLLTSFTLGKLRASQVNFSKRRALNHSLHLFCLLVESLGLGILLCFLFLSFSDLMHQGPLDFSARIAANTKWVKEELSIYFYSGGKLFSAHPNGQGLSIVYESKDPIREYHFSSDGKKILIVTTRTIVLYDLPTAQSECLETLDLPDPNPAQLQMSISGVRWDPTGQRFCFRVAQWSRYSSTATWYVYELAEKKKMPVKAQGAKLVDLQWDYNGENLYSVWFKSLDKATAGNAFVAKVYKIALTTLAAELVLDLPAKSPDLSADVLAEHGIVVDKRMPALSFSAGKYEGKEWISPQGYRLGIDEFDRLYYIKNYLFKRRLYVVPHEGSPFEDPRFKGRDYHYAVQELKWLPAGQYVVMAHSFLGVLILEPASGKIGILTNERGQGFGWYQP